MPSHRLLIGAVGLTVATALLACDPAPTEPAFELLHGGPLFKSTRAAAETTLRVIVPVDFVAPAGDCLEEAVHFTGEIRILLHLTNNRGVLPPVEQILVDNESIHMEGTGLTTGAHYRFNQVLRIGFESEDPVNTFPAVTQLVVHAVLTSPGQGAIALTTIRIFTVVNGTGEISVDESRFESRCL